MKKATITNKAFILFTLLFISIAIFSFAVFQETEKACNEVKKCSEAAPSNNGEMIWDVFSRRLISLVSYK
jgi:hypothetical protein